MKDFLNNNNNNERSLKKKNANFGFMILILHLAVAPESIAMHHGAAKEYLKFTIYAYMAAILPGTL